MRDTLFTRRRKLLAKLQHTELFAMENHRRVRVITFLFIQTIYFLSGIEFQINSLTYRWEVWDVLTHHLDTLSDKSKIEFFSNIIFLPKAKKCI